MKVNMKKLIVALLVLVLVIGGTVGGTLAWLSASADAVENTFTVGNITITLEETFNTKSDGSTKEDKWVGKIVPGGTQAKDPTITVAAGSEKCYVYVMVENTMTLKVKENGTETDVVVVTPNINNIDGENTVDWAVVKTVGNKTIYRYIGQLSTEGVVDATANEVELPVFTTVTYDGTYITEDNITNLAKNTITVDAYAHQSDNTTQNVADAAALAHFGISTTTP